MGIPSLSFLQSGQNLKSNPECKKTVRRHCGGESSCSTVNSVEKRAFTDRLDMMDDNTKPMILIHLNCRKNDQNERLKKKANYCSDNHHK